MTVSEALAQAAKTQESKMEINLIGVCIGRIPKVYRFESSKGFAD